MKKILNGNIYCLIILLISFCCFVNVEAIEIKYGVKSFQRYEIKEKSEVLVENTEILKYYENNIHDLDILIEEKNQELEIIEQQKKLELKTEIVDFSKQFIGNPYVLGGVSLTMGADCSGFVQSVFGNFNIQLPRTAGEQSMVGEGISLEQIEVGDIISYGYNGIITHSALYIGDDLIIHASTPELGIRIDSIYIMPIVTIRRVV